MPRYKVYYEGFYIVDADSKEEAEDDDMYTLYEEYAVREVEEIEDDEMFI